MDNFTLRTLLLSTLLGSAGQVRAQAPAQAPAPARTPEQPASLSGRVTDASGEAQPKTAVAIISLATGTRRSTVADANGVFLITGLVGGGPYVVQVQQPGFRPQPITNVFLKSGESTALAVTLSPETVAVGTRRDDRTALGSAVPVDVVDVAALLRTAPQTDLTQLLHYAVPAFNSTRQTNAGGADHVDPANLRGLGPDQVLVLVNGKRRHTTALVNLLGNRGVGSVGTDLNALPSLGVERVEVLRDGAAAQYGSDAIAGVMNVSLKSDNRAGSVLAASGLTTEGDGLAALLGLNKGFKLGQKGFLNLTADADQRNPTTRGYDRDALVSPVFVANDPAAEKTALAAAGKTYADFRQRNGEARTQNVRGLLNARVVASEALAFYAFGGYGFRRGQAATPWVTKARQPADVLAPFLDGYQPLVGTRSHDAAGTVGAVLGRSGSNHWTLDLSNTTGYNRMTFDLKNTLNSSLGTSKLADTKFDNAGGFQFGQNVSNVTANRFFDKVLAGTNVAFGGEFRYDYYSILYGDPKTQGRYDLFLNPQAQGGTQGFIGFSEDGNFSALEDTRGSRTNVGAFVDVDADITKRWSLSGAVRFENYSSFGSNFIYKATTRVQASKALALRAGFNTGFRAPSLQQVLFQQVAPLVPAAGSTGDLTAAVVFNNNNPLTRNKEVGINELKAEKSTNFSAGFVFSPSSAFSFTVDGYLINIKDRITLSGVLRTGDGSLLPDIEALLARKSVSRAQFFTNDLDTRTMGLDAVANYRHALGRGQFAATAAANFNRTTAEKNPPPKFLNLETDNDPSTNFIDPRQLSITKTGNPDTKILLNLSYNVGKLGLGLRNTYFGTVRYLDQAPDPALYRDFGAFMLQFNPRVTTDLLVSYQATEALGLTLGAQNLFNIKPNTVNEAATNGEAPLGRDGRRFGSRAEFERYFQAQYGYPAPFPANRDIYPYAPVQMGFSGAFVYLKAVYSLGI